MVYISFCETEDKGNQRFLLPKDLENIILKYKTQMYYLDVINEYKYLLKILKYSYIMNQILGNPSNECKWIKWALDRGQLCKYIFTCDNESGIYEFNTKLFIDYYCPYSGKKYG